MADKFEREIEEIIQQSGDLPPSPPSRRAVRRFRQPSAGRGLSVNPGRLALAAIAVLLVAVLLWGVANSLGGMLVLAALLLFLVVYVLAFGRRAAGGYEKRWRGQPIVHPSVPWGVRLRRIWWRLRH